VTDQFGNPVANTGVAWRVASGGGSLSGASTISSTSETGVAATPGNWILGQTIGTNTLTATVGNQTITFTATTIPGPPARLEFVVAPSTTTTNGQNLPTQPVLQLEDEYGNKTKVADVVVQITQIVGSGPGALVIWNDTSKTHSDGIATFTGTTINGPSGNGYRLGFTAPLTSTLSSDPITLLQGQPYKLALQTPASGATRGSVFAVQPVVQIVDAGGNPTATAECVNAGIDPGAILTGSTQINSVTATYAFYNLGISAASNPGTFTITYGTGCCAPNGALLPVSQQIQVP
jgi:hypothetical protein